MSVAKIDNSGLIRFIGKVNKLKNLTNIKEAIKKIGIEELNNAYDSDPSFDSLTITAEDTKEGIRFLIKDLKDKPTIAFIEFGTGFYSLDYEGKKPTQTLIFYSPALKKNVATAGWDYYYDNPKTKKNIGGVKGWFLPKDSRENFTGFDIGEGSHNTFYHACQRIKERIKEEVGIDVIL